jgi:probable HAF family extracellular repeat protein
MVTATTARSILPNRNRWPTILALLIAALSLIPSLRLDGRSQTGSPAGYVVTDLGTLGGLSAQAYDINESGEVVGYSTTAASQGHAFLWRNGMMTDLGTLSGTQAVANAINKFAQARPLRW